MQNSYPGRITRKLPRRFSSILRRFSPRESFFNFQLSRISHQDQSPEPSNINSYFVLYSFYVVYIYIVIYVIYRYRYV